MLAKSREQCFNCLEVTEILDKRLFGIHYTTIIGHSRHLQPRWRLDDIRQRRTEQQPVGSAGV
jgi:hypothetical protein